MEAAKYWGYRKIPKEELQIGVILPDNPKFFWKRLADALLRKLREANVRFELALVPQLRDDIQVCQCVQNIIEDVYKRQEAHRKRAGAVRKD